MDYNRQNQTTNQETPNKSNTPKISFVKVQRFLESKTINKKLVFYGILTLSLLILLPNLTSNIFSPVRRSVSVIGIGEKSIVPEKAIVSFSLVMNNPDRQSAIDLGEQKFNQIIGGLDTYSPETIRKLNYQITRGGIATANNTLGSNFQYTNAAEITLNNPQTAKEVLSYLYQTGATQVGQIRYIPKDQDKTNSEVRDLAIKDARNKASKMASSAGAGLGRVISITEGGNNTDTGTPITSSGDDITIQSAVTITYELR